MKKSSRKFCFKLKVINDGAAFYHNEHFWKGWIPLTNKDISSHYRWKDELGLTNNIDNHKSYITDYAKKFTKKQKVNQTL